MVSRSSDISCFLRELRLCWKVSQLRIGSIPPARQRKLGLKLFCFCFFPLFCLFLLWQNTPNMNVAISAESERAPENHVAATLAPVHVIKHQCVLIVQKCRQSHGPHAFSRPWPTRPQHGEVLPLKIVTYAAVSLSLAALLVAFVLLALVRTLRSNLNGIHKNLIAALFSSQLVFVIGIAQTENPVRTLPSAPCGATWARTWTDLLQGWGRRGLLTRSWGRAACLRLFPGMSEAGSLVGSWGPRPCTWACCFALGRNLPARSPWEPRALCTSTLTLVIQTLAVTSESTL